MRGARTVTLARRRREPQGTFPEALIGRHWPASRLDGGGDGLTIVASGSIPSPTNVRGRDRSIIRFDLALRTELLERTDLSRSAR
jgi:hypothetical protein